MGFYDPEDYINNCEGYLGEFVISNGSGWMYSVNNNFPNVSFSDVYLSDGDIVKVFLWDEKLSPACQPRILK